jgi:hypothetical protein
MGQNIKWKKRRMGQTSTGTKGRIVRNVNWKKLLMEKTLNGTRRQMENTPTGTKCRLEKMSTEGEKVRKDKKSIYMYYRIKMTKRMYNDKRYKLAKHLK